ncbi:kinesin-like protein KIF14, partial [Limulus polyphemus]|uniref:Kinesin-like protein KIF14 n=1 Tax=Limulus polyphemus TaxID=6850 RepID=A0ABM1TGF8_LIMPO
REGIALKVDGKSPCLVNLNEDPQLSETLLYLLHPGRTRLGRKDNSSDVEIQLHGSLLSREHCTLENNEGKVKVIPMPNAPVYVNGQEVIESTVLQHGDRLVVGGVHFFRLNNPCQSVIFKGVSSEEPVKDYLFARDELLQAQEARLKAEVSKARDQARIEMLTQLQDLKEEAQLELDIQRSNYEGQIHDLNMALKEKETKLQEAEKKKLMISPFKSNLLEEMIDLYSDVFTDLDTLKKQVAQTNLDNSTPSYHGDRSQSCELYALTLQLQEANHLAKDLGKTLEFRRCDLMTDKGLEQGVKVLDYTHNIVTFWSTEKFAEIYILDGINLSK